MKRALISAALAIAVIVSPASAQSPSVISKAHRSVVQVHSNGSTPEQSMFCTGVQVGIIRVLTAEHCVPEGTLETLVNGKPARVVKKSAWLVLLETAPADAVLDIASTDPPLGAEVTTIGYVDMAGTKLTLKRAVAGFGNPIGAPMFFLDGPLVQGMSGGPVIDVQGKLVGINQATNAWTGLASGVKSIREFLK